MNVGWELTHEGLSNRSDRARGISLVPNYKKCWDYMDFTNSKTEEKIKDFKKPRLDGPFDFCPAIPMDLFPHNVATDQLTPEGEIKPRLTFNPGFAPFFKGKCAPDSLNGQTDVLDTDKFPDIEYFTLSQLSIYAAILLTAGLELGQAADDMEAWYEQCPRRWDQSFTQFQMLAARKLYRDNRCKFGVRAEPHVTQRVSFFLRWCCVKEVTKRQLILEREGNIPEQAKQFAKDRRAKGFSGRFFDIGYFFDDQASVYFTFMKETLQAGCQHIWKKFGVSVADGRTLPERVVKDKHKDATGSQELELLGLRQMLHPPGMRTLGSAKRKRYSETGEKLWEQANKTNSYEFKPMEKWVGQLGFASSVDPSMAADLGLLRARTKIHKYRGGIPASKHAQRSVRSLVQRLKVQTGVALLPTKALMNGQRQPVIMTFTDAARDTQNPSAGYGMWMWLTGTKTIGLTRGKWSTWEQTALDSTALELHTQNMALQVATDWMEKKGRIQRPQKNPDGVGPNIFCDIAQIVDNSASDAIGNSGHASGPTQRQLYFARANWLQENQVRAVSIHAVREVLQIQAADDLSKALFRKAIEKIDTVFGEEMNYEFLPKPGERSRSLEPTLLAARY